MSDVLLVVARCARLWCLLIGVISGAPFAQAQNLSAQNPSELSAELPIVEFTQSAESIEIKNQVLVLEEPTGFSGKNLDEVASEFAAQQVEAFVAEHPEALVAASSIDFIAPDASNAEASAATRGEKILSRVQKRTQGFKRWMQRSVVQPIQNLISARPSAPKIRPVKAFGKTLDRTSLVMTVSRFVVPGVLSYIGLSVTTDIPSVKLMAYAASVFSASAIFALNAKRVNSIQGKGRIWSRDRTEVALAYEQGREPETKILSRTDFLDREQYLAAQESFVEWATNGSSDSPPMMVEQRVNGKKTQRVITAEEAKKVFQVSESIYSKSGRVKNFWHGMGNFLAFEYVFAYIFLGVYYEALDLDAITGKGFSLAAFLLGGLATTATQGVVEQGLAKFRDVASRLYGWTQAQIDAYFIRTSAAASIASVSAYAVLDAVPSLSVVGWSTLVGLGAGGGALLLRTTLHSKTLKEALDSKVCTGAFEGLPAPEMTEPSNTQPDAA